MARVLIVVPPLTGHVGPPAGVAAELAARGHEIGWAGSPRVVAAVAGPGARVYAAGPDPEGALAGRPPGLRAFAALRHLWAGFLCPLAQDMLPAVDEAVARFAPDLVLADQQAFAGPLAAQRHGVAWATSASTSAELGDPYAATPKVAAWIAEQQDALSRSAGCEPGVDLRFSPLLTLCYSVAELAGEPRGLPGPVRMVGPVLTARADAAGFPWQLLDSRRRLVLVTLGTANEEAGPRFLDACRTVLARRAATWQGVVVDPRAPHPTLGTDGVIAASRVPQLRLLRHAAAAVCHGGHNTVVEALASGVPLVLAPIRDDQPIVARQVTLAGAGVAVRFDRAGPDDIEAALAAVLDEPSYAVSTSDIGRALREAGGAAGAADALEHSCLMTVR